MSVKWPAITIGLSLLIGALTACQERSSPDQSTHRVSDAEFGSRMRMHMEALAADEMQGREAGTDGYQRAAAYVARQFQNIGLQELGNNGDYFQFVELIESRLAPDSAEISLHSRDDDTLLEFGVDFTMSGGFGREQDAVTAPLVFVGYGIRAPEYDHDDFAGVDVDGKIVVMMTGAPASFTNSERAYYSSGTQKQELASSLGAVGVVLVVSPIDRNRLTWQRLLRAAESPGMRWIDVNGTVQDGFPELLGYATLSDSGTRTLFSQAGYDADDLLEAVSSGSAGSFDLDVSASLTRHSLRSRTSSPNVLAVLPGSDDSLRDEYVLVSAHLDHLGVRTTADGATEVFNGLYDNAAGVATLLEMANSMAAMSPRPRRSVIFAAVTAEEKGLRGSDFLAHHPPVSIESIVANINIDMPYLGYPIANVEGFGVEHSTLHDALARAAASLDLQLTPDARPELVRLVRSDQFSFVKQGIPGLNLKPGSRSSDASIDGEVLRNSFLTEHYHSLSDDLSLPFSAEGAGRFGQLALAFALIVANDDARPRWKPGDFFGERYSQDRH